MKKFCILVLALILCAGCAYAAEISVQGSGCVYGTPDIVLIDASVSAMGGTVKEALEGMSGAVTEITGALTQAEIAAEDISTGNYSFSPEYDYSVSPEKLTGYSASYDMNVTCRDTEKLNDVIGAVTQGGSARIYSVSFDVSGKKEMYRQALGLAVKDAEEKAQVLAQAAGYGKVSVVRIEENTAGYGSADLYRNKEAAAVQSAPDQGIRPGSVSADAAVTVVFSME